MHVYMLPVLNDGPRYRLFPFHQRAAAAQQAQHSEPGGGRPEGLSLHLSNVSVNGCPYMLGLSDLPSFALENKSYPVGADICAHTPPSAGFC